MNQQNTFRHLAKITGGKILSCDQDIEVRELLLDTRKITIPSASLFFAIKGTRHDGHSYIDAAHKAGVRMFVVEREIAIPEGSNVLLVPNAIDALQKIVNFHRQQFSLEVIGITGSNGKTIVKEWLSQLLNKNHVVVKSPKSYNSQIGVPLSVWQIAEQHTLGVFEAGISMPGEMEKLQSIIQPSIGIITNIGSAHDEGFISKEEKVKEKIKLFSNAKTVIYCRDYEVIDKELHHHPGKFTWSLKEIADVQVLKIEKRNKNSDLFLLYKGEELTLDIPFTDDASIENMLHCITLMLYSAIDVEEMQNRLRLLQAVAMRLELKEGINDCYIIDDTYNNDIAGFALALDFLGQQKQRTRKTLIISDLLESGMPEEQLYSKIAEMLVSANVDRLIGIGEVISRNKKLFHIPAEFYTTTDSFAKEFDPEKYRQELILVKGARIFEFEKIVRLLQYKVHGTILEINLDALSHNLNYYTSKLEAGTKIMVMVKALAYGSGSFEVANLLQYHRVDYLAVAYADEGVQLRENGISIPVMVMNPSRDTFEKMLQYKLEPELYSFKILEEYIEYSKANDKAGKIHIKIDTGMHRLGFEKEEIGKLTVLLKANPQVKIASIFTHLAGADEEEHNEFTESQFQVFTEIAHSIESALGYTTIKHVLNSAGIVRFPKRQMDMVRLGIGLYGVEANGIDQTSLQVVGTLKTIISQIREIKKGETIGYSRRGKADNVMRIATIAIGYADGYNRRFSRGIGKVLISGKLCSVIGNVCMDMCMIDISNTDAKEGDEVIIFGKNPSIIEMAKSIDTISYEVLTGVSERVKRVFYRE